MRDSRISHPDCICFNLKISSGNNANRNIGFLFKICFNQICHIFLFRRNILYMCQFRHRTLCFRYCTQRLIIFLENGFIMLTDRFGKIINLFCRSHGFSEFLRSRFDTKLFRRPLFVKNTLIHIHRHNHIFSK